MGKLISFMKAMGLVALLFGIFVADGEASDPVIWIHEDINGENVNYTYTVILKQAFDEQHPHIVYVSGIKPGDDKPGSAHFRLFYYNGESVDNGGYVTIDAEGQQLIYKCDGTGILLDLDQEDEFEVPQSSSLQGFKFILLFSDTEGLALVKKIGGDDVYDMHEVACGNALPDFPLLPFINFIMNFAQHKAPGIILPFNHGIQQ
ncbi:MAG: hypothetical protein LBT67_02405 [Holosporaceae bacterium]|nr:hypothetical protein [Holosporaceae bacterium]